MGTTAQQRRDWVEDYWVRADPARCDGDGAESFNEFLVRVDDAINRLSQIDSRVVLVFGHGQFINAMRWRCSKEAENQGMQSFRAFDLKSPVAHCEPLTLFN